MRGKGNLCNNARGPLWWDLLLVSLGKMHQQVSVLFANNAPMSAKTTTFARIAREISLFEN